MDYVMELAKYVGEQYGLLPAYAIIITLGGFIATSRTHLLFILSIMGGVYVTMFKAFNLQGKLLPFDIMPWLPKDLPFALTLEHVNMIAAFIFVYVIGFVAYGLKRLVVPAEA